MKLISLIVITFFALNSFGAEAQDIVKVTFAKNAISVDAKTAIQKGDILTLGTLVAGDSPDSSLQFQWKDNKVLLNGKFKIKIQTLNKNNEPNVLNLVYGNLRALVSKDSPQKSFKVKTPAAVVGVRGTDFMVTFNDLLGETEVICFESKIDFQDSKANKKPTLIKEGQWGGLGGRFGGEIKKPLDLPENVLSHFKGLFQFN